MLDQYMKYLVEIRYKNRDIIFYASLPSAF